MPQKQKDTKIHKGLVILLCVFEPWWQKKYQHSVSQTFSGAAHADKSAHQAATSKLTTEVKPVSACLSVLA